MITKKKTQNFAVSPYVVCTSALPRPRGELVGNGASMIDVDVISADHGTCHEVEKKTCEM